MNKEDIIRMAREAGLWEMLTSFSNEFGNAKPEEDCMKELERFATLAYNEGRRHALYEARNALNDKFGL